MSHLLPHRTQLSRVNPDFTPTFRSYLDELLAGTLPAEVVKAILPFRDFIRKIAQHPAIVGDWQLEALQGFAKTEEGKPFQVVGVMESFATVPFWFNYSYHPSQEAPANVMAELKDVVEVAAEFGEFRQSMNHPETGRGTRFYLEGTDKSVDFQLIAQYVHDMLMASSGTMKAYFHKGVDDTSVAIATADGRLTATMAFANTGAGDIPYSPTWGNGSVMYTDRNPRPAEMTDEEEIYLITTQAGRPGSLDALGELTQDEGEFGTGDIPGDPAAIMNPAKLGEGEADLDQAQALASDATSTQALREEQGLDPEVLENEAGKAYVEAVETPNIIASQGPTDEPGDAGSVSVAIPQGETKVPIKYAAEAIRYAITEGPLKEAFAATGKNLNDPRDVAIWMKESGYQFDFVAHPESAYAILHIKRPVDRLMDVTDESPQTPVQMQAQVKPEELIAIGQADAKAAYAFAQEHNLPMPLAQGLAVITVKEFENFIVIKKALKRGIEEGHVALIDAFVADNVVELVGVENGTELIEFYRYSKHVLDYNQTFGEHKVQGVKVYGPYDATRLVGQLGANTQAPQADVLPRTVVKVKLDEFDPNPSETIEKIVAAYQSKAEHFPVGLRLVDIVNEPELLRGEYDTFYTQQMFDLFKTQGLKPRLVDDVIDFSAHTETPAEQSPYDSMGEAQ